MGKLLRVDERKTVRERAKREKLSCRVFVGWLVLLSEARAYFSNAVMVMLSNDTVKIIRNTGNEWAKEP